MKKWICALCALLLAACAVSVAMAETSDLLARIQEKGEIVIATEGDWSPWTYEDENGTLVGFDVEIARAIAGKLGVTATFIETPWEGIFAGLNDGRYDIVANGVDVTPERGETYDFSEPYAFLRTALVVRGDNEDIKSFEDLAGKSTVNSIGSTYMELAESYGAEATGVSTLDLTLENVINGRADATLNAELSIYDYLAARPDANIKIVALTAEANDVAIPVRKSTDSEDTSALLAAINQAIVELREEGVLAEISQKYFGSDITAVAAQ